MTGSDAVVLIFASNSTNVQKNDFLQQGGAVNLNMLFCFCLVSSAVAWHPVHEGLFASGGSDGSLLFWHTG